MSEQEMLAIFLLAGFTVENHWKIENEYWPDNEHYAEMRRASPWWLAQTEFGIVRIGWRKRVISMDWSGTGMKVEPSAVTPDDVTKTDSLAHAYGHGSAVNYLRNLRMALRRVKATTKAGDGEQGGSHGE